MLTLKYKILEDRALFGVFQRLMKSEMSINAAYKVKKYADFLDQAQKTHNEAIKKLLDQYGAKDANGNYELEYQGEGESSPFQGP